MTVRSRPNVAVEAASVFKVARIDLIGEGATSASWSLGRFNARVAEKAKSRRKR